MSKLSSLKTNKSINSNKGDGLEHDILRNGNSINSNDILVEEDNFTFPTGTTACPGSKVQRSTPLLIHVPEVESIVKHCMPYTGNMYITICFQDAMNAATIMVNVWMGSVNV